ncbi:MAG: TonB-dependent receptor domain-containing protein, partial [Ferruginibacter sp.]
NLKVITKVGNNLVETNLKNKRVENAPEHIVRLGFTYTYKDFTLTSQWSHTSAAYTDANNTVAATANGQNGLIPAYTVGDLTVTYTWNKVYNLKAGINNISDTRYFTRRSGGYPGPGVLPSDGRTVFVSIGASF